MRLNDFTLIYLNFSISLPPEMLNTFITSDYD
jgi:hypothetical protein